MTALVTEWKAANIVYLDFSKVFDILFIEILMRYEGWMCLQ